MGVWRGVSLIPKVSPGHAMPYPSTPCRRATPEMAAFLDCMSMIFRMQSTMSEFFSCILWVCCFTCKRPMARGGHGSLNFQTGPPCQTFLRHAGGPPLKRPYGCFKGGLPTWRAVCDRLLPPWTTHAVCLCYLQMFPRQTKRTECDRCEDDAITNPPKKSLLLFSCHDKKVEKLNFAIQI
jgi:hypothetical protein